jgi:hypothetical protein
MITAVRNWFQVRTRQREAEAGQEPGGGIPFGDDPSTFTWWALDKLPLGEHILLAMLSTVSPLDRLRTILSVLQVVESAEARREQSGGGGNYVVPDTSDSALEFSDGSGSESSDGSSEEAGSSSPVERAQL